MIQIIDVVKKLGGHIVLSGVNLNIDKGQTTVIIGRSGCGKSVLLKHIVGILRPDKGQVIINDKEIDKLSEKELNKERLKIGLLFQGGALFDSLTVGENVAFGLTEHDHFSEKEIAERVEESLCMVELGGIQNLMPSELSGGMKKRVALARVLCIKPEVILYDEPTTGVDPITADSINELIINLHDKLKITSVVVT
ncbi:MAG: ATP-binding cassette domain-containing protein, partial [Candidatus Omnitrophota bacterium]